MADTMVNSRGLARCPLTTGSQALCGEASTSPSKGSGLCPWLPRRDLWAPTMSHLVGLLFLNMALAIFSVPCTLPESGHPTSGGEIYFPPLEPGRTCEQNDSKLMLCDF